jgi:ferredoxin
VTHEITLERPGNRETSFTAESGETVLEAAARAGIRLPYDCRTGTCAECVGRVLEGRIEHRRAPRALDPKDEAESYALLCIATACEDCRIRVDPTVKTELGGSPWG